MIILFGARGVIDGSDQPQKDFGVYFLGKGITRILGDRHGQGYLEDFISGPDGTDGQCGGEYRSVHPHQFGQGNTIFDIVNFRSNVSSSIGTAV